ncbi:BZ3500_MvSof-1268-A1-R1_Chr4-2g07097 [Microbotryum saponariae]|uniref:BZ3500_MvSof-1268-A1-R1_Chr4-2g07097 protein n=1 Tax=Microbotryum saponariae TaxID=289078 RepID=A0A2X0MY85_9BASI|nr:BZ3500_MvSof-1268-A1-R1_Chr4-2g07097 [Microbotryum saponariae]SDA06762.1 BZ3501_MvSof-1269-A2-R1_Chr4-2g06808 [Microbotryum saponariae]
MTATAPQIVKPVPPTFAPRWDLEHVNTASSAGPWVGPCGRPEPIVAPLQKFSQRKQAAIEVDFIRFRWCWGDLLLMAAKISSNIDQWPCVESDVLDMRLWGEGIDCGWPSFTCWIG